MAFAGGQPESDHLRLPVTIDIRFDQRNGQELIRDEALSKYEENVRENYWCYQILI
jgi:hypothetical protein